MRDDLKKLSDEEITQIADKVAEKLTTNLYQNAGKGLIGLMVKGLLLILVGLAVFGVTGTLHIFGGHN